MGLVSLAPFVADRADATSLDFPVPAVEFPADGGGFVPQRFVDFPAPAPAPLGASGWPLAETLANTTWYFKNFSKVALIRRLSGIVTQDEAAAMLRHLPAVWEEEVDTVDKSPTFEYSMEINGVTEKKAEGTELLKIARRVIDDRLTPYVREVYDCPSCRVCTSFLRRYVPGERSKLFSHFDESSYITAVVALTDPGVHYLGGIYARTLPGTEAFIPLQLGDAVVHQGDLEHGVFVQGGSRYSWVIWIQDSDTCTAKREKWFKKAASNNDPVALVSYAETKDGLSDEEEFKIYRKAAKLNYPYAMWQLGQRYIGGLGTKRNQQEALTWITKAMDLGVAKAAMFLGHVYADSNAPPQQILPLLEKAIANHFDREPRALTLLGVVLADGGESVTRDLPRAMKLWEEAVTLKFAGNSTRAKPYYDMPSSMAAYHLGMVYQEGSSDPPMAADEDLARRWFERAMQLGISRRELEDRGARLAREGFGWGWR